LVKKGTIVDAAIIESSNRPLSQQKRQYLEEKPFFQIDADARSTKINNTWFSMSMEPDPWDRWLYELTNKSKNSKNWYFKAV